MKLQLAESRRKPSKFAQIATLSLLLIIPMYFTFFGNSSKKLPQQASSSVGVEIRPKAVEKKCDLFNGEWIPDPAAPYYTNDTCFAIQEHQNCMKFGRPDTGFLKWRWKPDGCELPGFDPHRFLELVKGKSLAFVGDSVARNHMQSLICLLSRVAYPTELSDPSNQNKRYEYQNHNFTIAIFWSPYLVRTGPLHTEPFDLFLDEPDPAWPAAIAPFDYLLVSAEHWFFRPTRFHIGRKLVGCLYCPDPAAAPLPPSFSYRLAYRTALRAVNGGGSGGFRGVAFVRTFAASHFEGGEWNGGGDCVRTAPLGRAAAAADGRLSEMHRIQVEEVGIARRSRGRFRLFDATGMMMMRPDGHPSRYGHLPGAKLVLVNDCVHWCLPGPIDALNDLLQELLEREMGGGGDE